MWSLWQYKKYKPFVLSQASHGLKVNSIVRRTGLRKGVVNDWIEVLMNEKVVLYNTYLDKYFVDKKVIYNLYY